MTHEARPHELRNLTAYLEIAQLGERESAMLQQAVRLLRHRHHESGGPFSEEAETATRRSLDEGPGASHELILSLAAIAEILTLIRKKEVGKGGGDCLVEIRDLLPRDSENQ